MFAVDGVGEVDGVEVEERVVGEVDALGLVGDQLDVAEALVC